MNLARLNHILIPATKEGRDRARRGVLVKFARPALWLYFALTDEGRFLAVFSILVGGAGLEVPSSQVHLVWAALFSALVVSLLFRPLFRRDGVRLDVHAPRRVTVGEEVTFALTLANDGPREHQAVRIEGPFLPWDGTWTEGRPGVAHLPPGARATVIARARFVARGEHHLDPFTAAALVPFGLAQGRVVSSPAALFLVVPKLADVRRLALSHGTRWQPGGVALASKTGESLELLGVRPYRPGDPIRDLHARTSARIGQPVVREYQQEFFSRIGVVLDTDAGAAPEEAREAAISLAAGVVAHLSRGEALLDLLVVGGEVHPLTVGRSLGFLEQALDHLACVRDGPAFAAEPLLASLEPFLSRLSAVVVVALRWDDGRRRLADELARRGAAVAAPGVGEGGDGATAVPVAAIVAGEPLDL